MGGVATAQVEFFSTALALVPLLVAGKSFLNKRSMLPAARAYLRSGNLIEDTPAAALQSASSDIPLNLKCSCSFLPWSLQSSFSSV